MMRYQVGGCLHIKDPSYVLRQADRELYACLKNGDFCYVLSPRQMGKSSLLHRTRNHLAEMGARCIYIDMTRFGSEGTTRAQWYKGMILNLFDSLNSTKIVGFKSWWDLHVDLPPLQKIHLAIEEILSADDNRQILIFIDELDSLFSLDFAVGDFFAWIRHCYEQRAHDPRFKRLGFALFGAIDPTDLIEDKRQTPFNIGKSIELFGFQKHEATPLIQGLIGNIERPEAVLDEIINWTGGQPFLTQKICQLITDLAEKSNHNQIDLDGIEISAWLEELIGQRIIQHWESNDHPEHLRTIRDRLLYDEQLAGRLLGIYQQICQAQTPVSIDDSREQTELLLSGLVEKRNGNLTIKNLIYRHVFNERWILKQLDNLRPYSQLFNAWVLSDYRDESRLLRGQTLADAQHWSQGKSLSNLDYRFLVASQESEQRDIQTALEAARAQELELRLAQVKNTAKWQRYLLIAIGSGLLISGGLAVGAFTLFRQTQTSELQEKIFAAEGKFFDHHRLDALIDAIKIKRQLQQLGQTDRQIARQADNLLERAVLGVNEYNRFSGHIASVATVDISPDGHLIASGSMDNTVKLWRQNGELVRTLVGHQAAVRAIGFSPDGQILASAGEDTTIKLWRQDGTLIKTLKSHDASVWGLAFSPDARFMVSGSWDRKIKVWDRDGNLLKTFVGNGLGFNRVAFSPDGRTIAAASLDKTVKLFRQDGSGWQNAKELPPLVGHTAWVTGIAFSPDGRTLASGSLDKQFKLWQINPQTGNYQITHTRRSHKAGISAVAFSPDGEIIATASRDKSIQLWNTDGAELIALKGHNSAIWGLKFSPDGSYLVSGSSDNSVRLWQRESPFYRQVILQGAGILSMAISPDSLRIATGSTSENIVKLWNHQGKLQQTFTGVFNPSFTSDSQSILMPTLRGDIQIKTFAGKSIASYQDKSSKIISARLSPNGRYLAAIDTTETAQIWQLDRPFHRLKLPIKSRSALWNMTFSPDSQMVAIGAGDGTVKVWSIDGKLLKTFSGHTSAVWKIAFSPDSKILASGSSDNTIKIWSIDGELAKTFTGHTAAIWGLAFSPDGKMLASGSVDETIVLWHLDGTEIRSLTGHIAAIRRIGISNDGNLLVSGGDGNKLIFWNLPRILKLDPLPYACGLVKDYLQTNSAVKASDRSVCD